MMNELTKLIRAATEVCQSATRHLDMADGLPVAVQLPLKACSCTCAGDGGCENEMTESEMRKSEKIDADLAKPKRKRRTKEEIAAAAAVKPSELAPAKASGADLAPGELLMPKPAKELTEEESAKKMPGVAASYVARFQSVSPDGATRLREILTKTYKVGKMTDLLHPQRVEVIKELEKYMQEADNAPLKA